MHVLLIVLKIAGILILSILALLLLILLAVLLIPIRYRVNAARSVDGETAANSADALISYASPLLRIRAVYENDFHAEGKVFGITVFSLPKPDEDNGLSEEGPEPEENATAADAMKEEEKKKKKRRKKSAKEEETPLAEEPSESSQKKNKDKNKKRKKKKGPVVPIMEQIHQWQCRLSDLFDRFLSLLDDCENWDERLKDAISEKLEKKTPLAKIITYPETGRAITSVFGLLRRLLGHLLPTDLTIDGTVGFDDPSITGKMCAVLGILMPKYKDHIRVNPVFDESIIEGTVFVKGRIRLGTLLRYVLAWVLTRDVRITIRRVIACQRKKTTSAKQ